MPQITARLSPRSRRRFEDYARSVGLNGSSLARLLLFRALQGGGMAIRRKKSVSKDGKLTAHDCGVEAVQRLRDYAEERRISKAEAAKHIFENELTDRWLAHAMGLGQHSRPSRLRRSRRG